MTFELVVDWYHWKIWYQSSCCVPIVFFLRVLVCVFTHVCFSENLFRGFRFSVKEEDNYQRLLKFKPCQRGVAGEREIQKMFDIPKRDTVRSIPIPS